MAIPADKNVVQKEADKKLKYKNLCAEIQRMWNLKCKIIPVIIGATGIVTKVLRKNLKIITGKRSLVSLQKTAILGPSHMIRKLLQSESRGLGDGIQEKNLEVKACDKRQQQQQHNNNNNINLMCGLPCIVIQCG